MRIVVFLFFGRKVVAIAVFLALGFAFYVFFAPFVGKSISYLYLVSIYLMKALKWYVFFACYALFSTILFSSSYVKLDTKTLNCTSESILCIAHWRTCIFAVSSCDEIKLFFFAYCLTMSREKSSLLKQHIESQAK